MEQVSAGVGVREGHEAVLYQRLEQAKTALSTAPARVLRCPELTKKGSTKGKGFWEGTDVTCRANELGLDANLPLSQPHAPCTWCTKQQMSTPCFVLLASTLQIQSVELLTMN